MRVFLSRWRRYQPCPGCHGARLRPEALAVKIEGRDIAGLSALTIRDARRFIAGLAALRRQPAAASILAQVDSRLGYLAEIGLDYLTLDRPARTLSAGELQRVGLTKILGSGLVNTLYVLDEPTLGLHPREVGRLIAILQPPARPRQHPGGRRARSRRHPECRPRRRPRARCGRGRRPGRLQRAARRSFRRSMARRPAIT